MRFIVVFLLVCLLVVGTVSALTLVKTTPTPTIKIFFIPTTTPTPAPGILHISTEASLDYLYIDNHLESGSYGLHQFDKTLAPGTHSIYLMAPSFGTQWSDDWYPAVESSISQSVQITSGRTTPVTLTPHAKGKLLFSSIRPDGGTLLIDNQDTLFQNQDGCFLVPGSHTVKYSKTGYVPYSTTVNVNALQKTPFSVSLQPVPAAAPADPVMVTNKPVAMQGQKFVLTITGTPSTDYYLYTVTVPLASGKSYPSIDASQSSVDISDATRSQIATRIGNSRSFANYPGTIAQVRTDLSGSRSVQLSTTTGTDAGTGGKYFTYELYVPADPLSGAQVSVRVDPVVDADFVASPLSGDAPLSVQFSDTSTGSPETWSWNFGDGSAGVATKNPLHTYSNPGTYTVNLTAAKNNIGGSSRDTASKTNYITVTAPGSSANNPAPAAPAVLTGSLTVTSSPSSAAVIIDDMVRGATPVTISGMSPGTYTVKLVRNGYPDYSSAVTVSSGQVTLLDADLSSSRQLPATQEPTGSPSPVTGTGANPPAPAGSGALSVTTQPSGAKVYIDGVMGGVTPTTIPSLPAGPHTVRLVMDGYEEIVTTVTILPDQTQQYATALSRGTGGIAGGVKIPGLERVPGFEAGIAFAGLFLYGVSRRFL